MSSGAEGSPFDQFLATAESVAQTRREVDLVIAREVFQEAATLLHNSLALDGLDGRDADAVVAGCASRGPLSVVEGRIRTWRPILPC